MIDGVTLDMSALVLPVLDTDACAVATRVQLVVVGDGVLLAAEHFNLLTWTTGSVSVWKSRPADQVQFLLSSGPRTAAHFMRSSSPPRVACHANRSGGTAGRRGGTRLT